MSGFSGGPSGARARDGVVFVHAAEVAGTRRGGRRVLSCCRPPGSRRRKNTAAVIWKKRAASRGDPPQGLTQKRMLKMQLELRHRTPGACEDPSEMFGGLQQRISLRALWRRLLAAQQRAQTVQPQPQFAPQPIHRLQRKRQPQLFHRRLERGGRQPLEQPLPQQRRRKRVARQHPGQQEGKRAPATAAAAAIGTKDPLTTRHPGVHPRGVVAVEFAVAI